MATKKIRETEYWCCGTEGHFHTTEVIAQNCEQKKRNTKPKVNHWVRNIEICKDILEGSSFVAVAKKVGLSAARVRQIFYSRMFRLRAFVEISPHRSEQQSMYRYKKEELIQRLNSLLEVD